MITHKSMNDTKEAPLKNYEKVCTVRSTILLFVISLIFIFYVSIQFLLSLNFLIIGSLNEIYIVSMVIFIISFLLYVYYFYSAINKLSSHINSSTNIITEIVMTNNLANDHYLLQELNGIKASIIVFRKIYLLILFIFPPFVIYVLYYVKKIFCQHVIHEYKTIYLIVNKNVRDVKLLGGNIPKTRKLTEIIVLSILSFGVYLVYEWYIFSRDLEEHLKLYEMWISRSKLDDS